MRNKKSRYLREKFSFCGERGIRTPGTLIGYASLANWWIKPLSHLSILRFQPPDSYRDRHLSNKLHKSIKLIDIRKKNLKKFNRSIIFFEYLYFLLYFLPPLSGLEIESLIFVSACIFLNL